MKSEGSVCAYVYDEGAEGTPRAELPDDWTCPVGEAEKGSFEPVGGAVEGASSPSVPP